jgi:L-seryl-tRNA(Ser) seleniumtransferase
VTTRREFVQRSVVAGAFLGLKPADAIELANQNAAGLPAAPVDYYDKLGVAKIINAAGTYTYLTASLMPPEVLSAVAIAAQHPVRLRDLQTAAGAYLAKKLQCEGAVVTSGAQGGILLATAACLTLGKPDESADLPLRVGAMKNECLIQKAHRFSHDQGIEMCGMKLVEVVTPADYEAAFNERTGMAFFFNAAEGGEIDRQQWVDIAHKHGVPCFLDAAADVPPISNFWNYTKMGFDLVTFSGGKGIRGPQNAGLLLGRKDLIEAAAANNNPNDRSVGRGMKVAKEQIVGMVAAVDWFLAQSDEQIESSARQRAERIARALKDLPTVTTEIVVPPVANHVPHLLIKYDQQRIAITPLDVAAALRNGKPSIEVNPGTGHESGAAGLKSDANTIVIGPWMMKPGEDEIVGQRLHAVLHAAITPGAAVGR